MNKHSDSAASDFNNTVDLKLKGFKVYEIESGVNSAPTYDVLLCPVNPMTATRHGLQEYVVDGKTVSAYHVMAATAPFNATGLPALSVHVTLSSEKLPINIQLVARWFDEATILELGEQIQTGSDAYGTHPIA